MKGGERHKQDSQASKLLTKQYETVRNGRSTISSKEKGSRMLTHLPKALDVVHFPQILANVMLMLYGIVTGMCVEGAGF